MKVENANFPSITLVSVRIRILKGQISGTDHSQSKKRAAIFSYAQSHYHQATLSTLMMDESSNEKRNKKRKMTKNNATQIEELKVVEEESLSFASFRLDPRLLKAISTNFETPTLVQSAAIPLALNGSDIVARAKTGSGKTAAYVIPIVHQILTKSVNSSAGRN
jgi:ATP-dependent helicase YprA (DUF1998 family)